MKTKLTLGYSPCPNDCFIFDALVHHKIDTKGYLFEVVHEDVETLNKWAMKGKLDITKLSFHAWLHCTHNYLLLNAGSALGFNCGPLLIAKKNFSLEEVSSGNLTIAIPGEYTTANLLFSIAFPKAKKKQAILFSEIEDKVTHGEFDAGLIIHENRFTYQSKGLQKIIDLGEYWESLVKAPIPLGGICIKRTHAQHLSLEIDKLIRQSVLYAFENPESSMSYVKEHAQEMDTEVMKQHIKLYVNNYTVDLGTEGKKAIDTLIHRSNDKGLIKEVVKPFFV